MLGSETLPLIIQNTLQPLFDCGPISGVLKTTTRGAFFGAQKRQPETCLPNNKCLFNYSHLPKNGHKYCCRQARLAWKQPEAFRPNRLPAFAAPGCFSLPSLTPRKHALPLPDCTQLCLWQATKSTHTPHNLWYYGNKIAKTYKSIQNAAGIFSTSCQTPSPLPSLQDSGDAGESSCPQLPVQMVRVYVQSRTYTDTNTLQVCQPGACCQR